jgi:hypothetical protein
MAFLDDPLGDGSDIEERNFYQEEYLLASPTQSNNENDLPETFNGSQ